MLSIQRINWISALFRRRIFSIAVLWLVAFACHANNFSTLHSTFLHFMGGLDFNNLSNSGSVAINSMVVNNYTTANHTTLQPLVGLGIEHIFNENENNAVYLGLGLAGYYAKLGEIKGTEYPFANDGNYGTLQYNFDASASAMMLEPRAIYVNSNWQPYVLIGVGWSWNNLSSYNESGACQNGAAPVPQTFSSRTNNTLAYEVGLGIQHEFYYDTHYDIHYLFSGDYRYFNFGKGQLAPFPAQTTSDTLQVSNLVTQVLLFQIQTSFW